MEMITSPANAGIRQLIRLQQKAKERKDTGCFVAEGIRIVLDTVPQALRTIYISEKLLEEAKSGSHPQSEQILKCLASAQEAGAGCYSVSQQVFEKAADTQSPQGLIAIVRMPVYTMEDILHDPDGRTPLLLITEDVRDPGNLGTMFRTAEAAGVTGIIMSKGTADLFNPKTVRSTMSAVYRMPFVYVDDFAALPGRLKAEGIKLYAAYLGGRRMYDEPDYKGPSAFLIGNEANGLKAETADAADEKILIPMQGSIESLNAAMSAGILMYEASRQRRQ